MSCVSVVSIFEEIMLWVSLRKLTMLRRNCAVIVFRNATATVTENVFIVYRLCL